MKKCIKIPVLVFIIANAFPDQNIAAAQSKTVSKNQIQRFEHLFFKPINKDTTNLCYAVAKTTSGNKAIKTVIETPEWHYVESFKDKKVQFIGKLENDKIIALDNGNVYVTVSDGDKKIWDNTNSIYDNKDKNLSIIDIAGASKDKFWITMHSKATNETSVICMTRIANSYGYTVEKTDYKAVAITPDDKYAWFMSPLSQDDSSLTLSIEELGTKTKDKPQSKTISRDSDDDNDSFEDAPTTLDEKISQSIKRFIAIDEKRAYILDRNGALYSLDSNVIANKINISPLNHIDTIAALGTDLVVTDENKIYRYTNKQFILLSQNGTIESSKAAEPKKEAALVQTTSQEIIVAQPAPTEATSIKSPTISPEPVASKTPTPKPAPTVSPDVQRSLPPLTEKTLLETITAQKGLKDPIGTLDTEKKALTIDKPVAQKTTLKQNKYDPVIQHYYDPQIEDETQRLSKSPYKPSITNQPAQSGSYWDFVKKSAAAARVKAQGALQDYARKSSGWFKSWYSRKE